MVALVAWLETLDETQLCEYRFLLYDVGEAADPESDLHAFALAALERVQALEARWAMRRLLRDVCRVEIPEVDAEAFADAVQALVRAQRQLGVEIDADVFRGAFEVAERRAAANSHEKEQI